MGGKKGNKIRLLYLADILKKYTDEENSLSSAELIKKLEEKGISAERKAIYDDVSVLCECGMDIIKTRYPKAGYYLASREFEVPEIYLLADAVQAAGFISHGKTRELVKKLENMLSQSQAKSINRSVYIDNRNKCANEEIFYSIDAATRAVSEGKKLVFKYCRRTLDETGEIITSEKEMTVSPYALTWSGNHYYLVCNNEKYDNLMNLRLDRMKKVTVTEKTARHFSEVSDYKNYFDTADYAQKTFNMFDGEQTEVTLRCKAELLEQILDRFTDKVSVTDVRDGYFTVRTQALVSDGFADWILQFDNGIKVCSPKTLSDMIYDKARKILENYEK